MSKLKLFTVVRRDLSPGQQIVQAAHAVADWTQAFPYDAERWNSKSNTMVILSVRAESELRLLYGVILALDLPVTNFHEPDMNDEMTAFTFLPTPKYAEILSHLPLAGSRPQ